MEALKILPARVRIASILKKAIYNGEYRAGDILSLTDVAAQLGVSRTPVREAFQQLEAEGLITLRMNKGAVVNLIDRKFVQDCFEMRILLESEAAFLAAQHGMKDADSLLERLDRLEGMIERVSREEYEELNQEIHLLIWNAADNAKLSAYLMELWNGPSTAHSGPGIREHYIESTKEHKEILAAIRGGDPDKARSAMKRHISRSRDNILKLYE